jgi:hypothetical protein
VLKRVVVIILFFHLMAAPNLIFSQEVEKDSVKVSKVDSASAISRKRANRAALMSAVVPGLGQISNKKYWKLPILYSATGAIVYFIHSNNVEYKKFKQALVFRNDTDSLTTDDFPRFTNEDLTVRKDYYRRNRDLSYIFAVVLYSLNIIDAYVDAQLMNFDVSDDLSIRTTPAINYLHDGSPVASLQFTFSFK